MFTVTNKLPTTLVIPNAMEDKSSLIMEPKGKAKLEKITASVKEAENNKHLHIGYPSQKKEKKG